MGKKHRVGGRSRVNYLSNIRLDVMMGEVLKIL